MSIVDNLNFNRDDIQNNHEVAKFFMTMRECEKRHKDVIEHSHNRMLNLKYRGKDLEINVNMIARLSKLCTNWTTEEVYNLVLKAVNNDPNYIKFQKFVRECVETIRDIKKQKEQVRIKNAGERMRISRTLREKKISVGVVSYAYKQMKAKARFYIDNELNIKNNGLEKYAYLDSFVSVFAIKEIQEYRKKRAEPKTIPVEVLSAHGSEALTKEVLEFLVAEAFKVNKRLDQQKIEQKKMVENEISKLFGLKAPNPEIDTGKVMQNL